MTDLQQAIRDSAKALGKDIHTQPIVRGTGVGTGRTYIKTGELLYEEWNPPENEKQDRLLRDWLLEEGWFVCSYGPHEHMVEHSQNTHLPEFRFNCPPNEFLTRATAAVWAVKEQDK